MANRRIIVEVSPHAGSAGVQRYVFEQEAIRVGRGYANDIILNDPHISAHHVTITRNETGNLVIHDQESLNGVIVNDDEEVIKQRNIGSGDQITIGRTRIHIFDEHHIVDPAIPVLPGVKALERLGEPGFSGLIFLALLLVLAGFSWYEVWSSEPKMKMLEFVLIPAAGLLVWAAGWAVAGRLIRHKGRYTAHLSIAAIYILASMAGYYLVSYARFLSSDSLAADIFSYALSAVLLYYLLKLHFRLSSHMPSRRRRMIAAAFAAGLVIGVVGVGYLSQQEFDPSPKFSWEMKPYLTSFAPVQSVDVYLAETNELFAKAVEEAAKKD